MDVPKLDKVCLLHDFPPYYYPIMESLHPVWRRCHCNESFHRHNYFSERAFGPPRHRMFPIFLLQVCNDAKDFHAFLGKDRHLSNQTGDMTWVRSWDCEATAWTKVTTEWRARRLWQPSWRFVPGNECSLEAFLRRVAILLWSTDDKIFDIIRVLKPLTGVVKKGLKDRNLDDLDLESNEDMGDFLRRMLGCLEGDNTTSGSSTSEGGDEVDGAACLEAETRDVDIDTHEGCDAEDGMLEDTASEKHDPVQDCTPPVVCKADPGSHNEPTVSLWRSFKATASQNVNERDERSSISQESKCELSRGIKRSREKEIDKRDEDDISRHLEELDIRPSKMARRHLMTCDGGSNKQKYQRSSEGARRGAISYPENYLPEALARLGIAAGDGEDE